MRTQANRAATRPRTLVRFASGLVLTCVWMGVAAAEPPTTQPATKRTATKTPAQPSAQPATPAVQGKPAGTQAKAPVRRVRTPRSEYPPDPNAKWACDQSEVVLDPVWRQGDLKLTFSFTIRNKGTADLKIKAKGG